MTNVKRYLKRKQKRHCNLPISCDIEGYDIGIVAVQGETKAAAAIIINRLEDDKWVFFNMDLHSASEEEVIKEFLGTVVIEQLHFSSILDVVDGMQEKAVQSSQNALDLMMQRWHTLHPQSESGEAALYVITSTMNDSDVSENTERVLVEFNNISITAEETEDGVHWMVFADGEKEEGTSDEQSAVITAIGLFMEYCTNVPDADDITVIGEGTLRSQEEDFKDYN